jgi:AhpD family alkylhydroperoxidase
MVRIRPIPGEAWPEELRQVADPDGRSPTEQGTLRIYAHRPELAVAYARFMTSLRASSQLPPRLLELVRLRVAFHNQCRSCMAIRYDAAVEDGVDEGLVCQLEAPEEAEDLTAAERAALHFADQLATDHHAIDDETFSRLAEHFDEAEIVELGMHVATFVGYGRLAMAWDMVDELPEPFRDGQPGLGPWTGQPVTVGRSR